MRKNKKYSLIFGLVLLLVGFGIGYAYLNTSLYINGTTNVDSNSWDVYWDNVQVTTGSVAAETPEIDGEGTSVSFSVHLEKPGDAVNEGTIDAMIETLTKTVNGASTIPAYLNYTVTYEDDIAITENHLLSAQDFEIYKVRVEYKPDVNVDDLPATAQSLTMEFEINYVQADSTVLPVRTEIYTVSGSNLTIGGTLPNGFTTYDNYFDALDAINDHCFLRHIISNDIVYESYVGFEVEGNVYYIKGSANGTSVSPYYTTNKEILDIAFGTENCQESGSNYTCTASGVTATISSANSAVSAGSTKTCTINSSGVSQCS